jgi:hypothetical protein
MSTSSMSMRVDSWVTESSATCYESRQEAMRDARGFVKRRIPELPDEAEVEAGGFYLKCWGFCVTIEF